MTSRIEIAGETGGKRTVEIDGDKVVLGSGAAADVRLRGAGIAERELVLVRTAGGYRAEPCRPGVLLSINGEELLCKDMTPGDLLTTGSLRLRWFGEHVGPVAATPRSPSLRPEPRDGTPDRRPTRNRGTGRQRGVPSWVLASTVIAVAGALILLVARTCSQTTWPRSPQHYVDLAREQFVRGDPERALGTLEFALREAQGATRQGGEALRREIQALLALSADLPRLQAARVAAEGLQGFAARYLVGGSERPAARGLVHLADQWLAEYRDVVNRHAEGAASLKTVEDLRARHLATAQLGTPDLPTDVVFVATSRLRFVARPYPEAVAVLDRWLTDHPGDPEVTVARARMLRDGKEWLDGRLRFVEQLAEQGRSSDAARELRALEERSLLPEWSEEFHARKERILAGR